MQFCTKSKRSTRLPHVFNTPSTEAHHEQSRPLGIESPLVSIALVILRCGYILGADSN
jgi:hypothetical protein